MNAEAKLDRPRSLTELAVERIRATIVEGRLAFGEQISESVLALRLGISKTPVREALLRLKLEGLVDIRPQRGTFVFRIDDDGVDQICRFREIVESAALADAMSTNFAALVHRLEVNLAEMSRAHRARDPAALPRLDADFHGAILELCGNDYLRAAYQLVEHKVHALRWRLPDDNVQVEHCQDNHVVIVAQIREGNVGKAQTMLKRHIRETRDAYLEASRKTAPVQPRRAV